MPTVNSSIPDPAEDAQEKRATTQRTQRRRRSLKDKCRHSVFRYETDQRKHMVCMFCGRRRRIKFMSDTEATVGRWVLPRKKKAPKSKE